MSSNFFRGTTAEQDSRWGDAEKKLLRRTKFSKVLEQKVNMKKVNMDVMQRWIAQRITSLLGFEDDIVVGTCVNYLSEEGKLDPKKLQLQLTGFLEKSTGMFMEELWGLLVDAQSSLGGIPSAFLQDKKQELLQKKEQEAKQEEELRRRMVEHQQELERTAALAQAHAPTEQDASSSAAPILPRPGKRRASRWGVSQVNVATTSDATTPDAEKVVVPGTDAPAAVGGDSEMHNGDRSPSDISSSRHDDGDRRKEKRKSKKSRHGKKADRKKHRRSRKTEASERSGDEGTSSEEDEQGDKSAVDVEEALRQRLLASKKERHTQGDD